MATEQHPTVDEAMQAILTGIYATSLAAVKAVQESQSVAFGDDNGAPRDIQLAGGLAATAAQAAAATRDLTAALAQMRETYPPVP